MTETPRDAAAHVKEMLAALSRLLEALDRRVPHLERLGEPQIAHDAAELRQRSVSVMRRLERLHNLEGDSGWHGPRRPRT